jgi:hypothetical protein
MGRELSELLCLRIFPKLNFKGHDRSREGPCEIFVQLEVPIAKIEGHAEVGGVNSTESEWFDNSVVNLSFN